MYFVFTIFAFITLAAARPLGDQVSSNFSHLDVSYHSPDARMHGDEKVVHIDVSESIDPHKTTMKFNRTFAGAHFATAYKLLHRPTTTTISTTSRSRTVTSSTTASIIIAVPNGTTRIITTTTEPAESIEKPFTIASYFQTLVTIKIDSKLKFIIRSFQKLTNHFNLYCDNSTEDQTSPPTTFTPIQTTTIEPERNVSKPENATVVIQQLMEQNRRLMNYISRFKMNQTSTPD
ncbi:uncharacterized protein LOC124409605 [Diprion similis]|uniref:uncharacterized protein LOC124409605 n=1 Tax=Diprion similis TaxID=362088 RepID=UPI001EF80B7B|nr:uncharacterized protein LOC124409605 [Diprion similis]